MKTVLASAGLMAATASAVTTVGDGVPLVYAAKPYPASIYNGTQYNATVINNVPYNSSNEWPCLTAKQYESILPSCSVSCIDLALNGDNCDIDDFVCHCETLHSYKLDSIVVPCLTTGATATCNDEEIGQLVNFVHGALCPYFEAVTDAYDSCPTSTASTSTGKASTTLATATAVGKPTTSVWTTVEKTWTSICDGPTTFAVNNKTFTVDSATTLVVSDWPMTVTSTSVWFAAEATGVSFQNASSPAVTSASVGAAKGSPTAAAGPSADAGSSPAHVATGGAENVRVGAGVAVAAVGVIAMML